MVTIFGFAVAAAVYPQLLAVVIVILTRPAPKPLLWACYIASVTVSIGASIVLLVVFRSRGTVAGTSSSHVGPAVYLTAGALAVALALFAFTRPGRELLGRDLPRVRLRRPGSGAGSENVDRGPSRAEQALQEGSLAVAAIVGAALGVPGPFDFLALGHLARGDHTRLTIVVTIVLFTVVKFLLIEVPILGYAIRPDSTASGVRRFAGWMRTHRLDVIAAAVGVLGVVLIGRGIAGAT